MNEYLCTAPRTSIWLRTIDHVHRVDATKYSVPMVTLRDVRFNVSLRGLDEKSFVQIAEAHRFATDYDKMLKEAKNQNGRFLVLKTLYDKGLVGTRIMRRTVNSLILHTPSIDELRSLRHSVSFDDELVSMVDSSLKIAATQEIDFSQPPKLH